MERKHPRIAGRAVIVQDGKILLVNATRHKGDDKWCTPGGGVDLGENLKIGLSREVFEETGLDVVIHDLTAVSEYFNREDNFHQIDMFFKATIRNGELSDTWQDTCGVVQQRGFFSLDEVKNMKILPAFLQEGFWLHSNQNGPIYRGSEEGEDLKWKM